MRNIRSGRRWGFLIVACALFGSAAGAVISSFYGDKIMIRQLSTPIGKLADGTLLESQFEISNRGAVNIEIVKIVRMCGCQTAEMDIRLIPPSGSAVLTLETRLKESELAIDRDVVLWCRGRALNKINVPLRIPKVGPGLLASNSVDFGLISKGDKCELPLARVSPSAKVASVDIESWDQEYLSFATTGVEEAATLTIDGSRFCGHVVAQVRVHVAGDDGTIVPQSVKCRGLIKGPVQAIPSVGILTTRKSTTFTFSADVSPIQILFVKLLGLPKSYFTATKNENTVQVNFSERNVDGFIKKKIDANGGTDGRLLVELKCEDGVERVNIPLIVEVNSESN